MFYSQSEMASLTEDIEKAERALKDQEDEDAAAVAAATTSISAVMERTFELN